MGRYPYVPFFLPQRGNFLLLLVIRVQMHELPILEPLSSFIKGKRRQTLFVSLATGSQGIYLSVTVPRRFIREFIYRRHFY
jgi:hypothetical protein